MAATKTVKTEQRMSTRTLMLHNVKAFWPGATGLAIIVWGLPHLYAALGMAG